MLVTLDVSHSERDIVTTSFVSIFLELNKYDMFVMADVSKSSTALMVSGMLGSTAAISLSSSIRAFLASVVGFDVESGVKSDVQFEMEFNSLQPGKIILNRSNAIVFGTPIVDYLTHNLN